MRRYGRQDGPGDSHLIREPSTSDIADLCDWAELQAIRSLRSAWTTGDIIKYVRVDDTSLEDDEAEIRESENDEKIADDVIGVAVTRARQFGEYYPFEVTQQTIRCRLPEGGEIPRQMRAYLFYLFFSGLHSSRISNSNRHQFELESSRVLGHFFSGDCFHFGWTSENATIGHIEERLRCFCDTSKICWSVRNPLEISSNRKDIGIDILVWKKPLDDRENCLAVIGQCATGTNWKSKLASSAAALLKDCIIPRPSGPVVYAFLMPYYVESSKWHEVAVESNGGLVFDRLRLVNQGKGTSRGNRGALFEENSSKWVQQVVSSLRVRPVSERRTTGAVKTPPRKQGRVDRAQRRRSLRR